MEAEQLGQQFRRKVIQNSISWGYCNFTGHTLTGLLNAGFTILVDTSSRHPNFSIRRELIAINFKIIRHTFLIVCTARGSLLQTAEHNPLQLCFSFCCLLNSKPIHILTSLNISTCPASIPMDAPWNFPSFPCHSPICVSLPTSLMSSVQVNQPGNKKQTSDDESQNLTTYKNKTELGTLLPQSHSNVKQKSNQQVVPRDKLDKITPDIIL